MLQEFNVAEDVAVKELKEFIEYHLDEPKTEEDITRDYWDCVKAVMRGNLILEDKDSPVLTLQKPINREGGGVEVGEVKFLTRIAKSHLASLAKGMDLQKDTLTFANRMTAYFIQQPSVPMLDKYGKHDMKIIDQLVGLFQ
jgi:hypothetical protein